MQKQKVYMCVCVCAYLCLPFFVLLLELPKSNLKCSTRVWRSCIISLHNSKNTTIGSRLLQSLMEELFPGYGMIDLKQRDVRKTTKNLKRWQSVFQASWTMMKVPPQGLLKAYLQELPGSPLRMHLFPDCFWVAAWQCEVILSGNKETKWIVCVLCLLSRQHHVTSKRIMFRAE